MRKYLRSLICLRLEKGDLGVICLRLSNELKGLTELQVILQGEFG